tara:strand:- start:155 stop:325 length:171 start_codon:yes stop_codon:yes gene_type:complete
VLFLFISFLKEKIPLLKKVFVDMSISKCKTTTKKSKYQTVRALAFHHPLTIYLLIT